MTMDFYTAFKVIFSFFFTQELKTRRIKIFLALSLTPALILLVAKIIELSNPAVDVTADEVFSKALLIVYIQLLVPVLALLYGSMIINEDVDNKTLVFLTTSPIPKPSIIFAKFTAYGILAAIIMNIGLITCFLVININHLSNPVHTREFLMFTGASTIALFSYMAFFTLLGTVLKRSIIAGFLFIFGWESIVQYFPGITQKFTIMHWVKSLLPTVTEGDSFLKFLIARLEPSSTLESLTVLFVFIIACLVFSSAIFNNKEYALADSN
jgi:ABC-2 type transport system permease protein